MNPETGEFKVLRGMAAEMEAKAKGWKQFEVGQRTTINGVEFRVRKITNKDIVLRPMANPDDTDE